MSLTKEYCESHDLDLFFFVGEYPIHIATNGGPIPSLVDFEQLMEMRKKVIALPILNERCRVNTENSHLRMMRENIVGNRNEDRELRNVYTEWLDPESRQTLYLEGFCEIAFKGFFSFDRKITNVENDTVYELVAGPTNMISKESKFGRWLCEQEISFKFFETTNFEEQIVKFLGENNRES